MIIALMTALMFIIVAYFMYCDLEMDCDSGSLGSMDNHINPVIEVTTLEQLMKRQNNTKVQYYCTCYFNQICALDCSHFVKCPLGPAAWPVHLKLWHFMYQHQVRFINIFSCIIVNSFDSLNLLRIAYDRIV